MKKEVKNKMKTPDSFTEITKSVKEQIDYVNLMKSEKTDPGLLDCVVTLIAEVYMSKEAKTFIGRETRSREEVMDRFLQLTSEHIEYVFECLNKTKSEIRNIRQYLRASLFNAPATMDAYIQRKVHEQLGY